FYFGVRDKSNVLAGVAAGNSVVIDNIRLTSTLSVTDIDNVKLTHFYNLANQTFNVESSNGSINTVKIYNLSGQEVFNIVVNDLNATVNMNNLNAGVYIAQISVDGTSQSVKFIKE
ncbi:MAG: T9SS type A sorting domain-containing protein, partial [Nonlabens sp.]|nr:T9SS type A sorting domain-containing protein [Nonlabens sp.]